MRRLISAGLVVIVVLALLAGAVALIGAYTLLPPILESAVAGDVQDELNLDQAPEVRLENDPQTAILVGNFSGGRVSLRGVNLGGVRAERAIVDLDPFDVDVPESVFRGEAVGDGPLSGRLRVTISEAEMSRLAGDAAGMPIDGVQLEDGGMRVRSTITVFGIEVPVSASGKLSLRDGKLVFGPDSLEAAGSPVPNEMSDQLLSDAAFTYPLQGLPDGTRITGVRVEENSLVLTGGIQGLRLSRSG